MKLALSSDHAAYDLKEKLKIHLSALGHEIRDLGTCNTDPVDYPDFALAIGQAVAGGEVERGILLCGSGVGASVAANKVKGVRAAICHDSYSAHQGVEHDNMNVLVLGGRIVGEALAKELAEAFLKARFTHEERHLRRLNKVLNIEAQNS